jgi:2-polyprenyl-3-methyl-5-hydroxy-6-metoxy-1,4-benzoquinol methylase
MTTSTFMQKNRSTDRKLQEIKMPSKENLSNSTGNRLANALRITIYKNYLRIHWWLHPRMTSKFCQPLFGGLSPSNVFHYRSEFFIGHVCSNDTVIDIACGTGKMLHSLSPHIKKGYGIEINKTNFSLCKNKHSADNIDYIEGDIFHIDYNTLKQKTGYTKAIFSHILEHVKDAPALLKAVNAETILICVPSQENWRSQLLIHLKLPYIGSTHFREYTREMLNNELKAASYQVDFMGFNSEGEIICCATLKPAS